MQELLTALEAAPFAEALRLWRWAYPLVNAAHILGVALLFGAIVPLDLRLLGVWRTVSARELARVLVPVAGTGLGLALLTGPMLFVVDPLHYADLPLFQVKLLLIAVGAVNLLLLHYSQAWRELRTDTLRLRLAALVSVLVWLAVVLCGRFIAYV